MPAILSFFAKYWKEVALAVLLFVACFFWWQDHNSLVKAYDASVESYETRIKELSKSFQRETEKKEVALEKYKEEISILEAEYLSYKEESERLKEQKVDEYIILRKENPGELVLKIEQTFGFEHVE